jgi:hypothetical protein
VVPKVALQFTRDGRSGEGAERPFSTGVEPVEGQDESDAGDLNEVGRIFRPAGEPPGQADGERIVVGQQGVP